MPDKKTAKFVSNNGQPFTFRVAAAGDFADIEGVLKDGRLTIGEEPTEVGVVSRKVTQSVVQADGTTRAVETEKETDLAAKARQYVPVFLSEIKDGDKPRASAAKDDGKKGR